ncbi:MAG: signal peptidase II [Chloroflexota bacterium]|nr:signal peptidase II [Chloroflexota bacterium]
MTGPSTKRGRWFLFAAVAIVVVIADQLSKLWIDANFAVAPVHPTPSFPAPTPVLGEFVRIAKAYNTGGIFGLFGNTAAILAVTSTVVIGLIVVYQWREGSRSAWPLALALGLLLGGAVGNFIDRVRLGGVIDFVDMGIGNWRFYTFNVADSAISTSLLLFIVIGVFGERIAARLRDRNAV